MSSFFLQKFKSRNKSKTPSSKDNNNNKIECKSTPITNSNETAIAIIKQIGQRHGEDRNFDLRKLEFDTKTLVNLMKKNRRDKHIQRISCHTLSNMAIQQEKCPIICKHNAHKLILRAVMDNIDDWKMCWLGMSAIWNLARPEICRKQFDSVSSQRLIYKVINKHTTIHLVIETALGALSNLVLYQKTRIQWGKFHILQFLIEVIKKHTKHCNVATASAGLITNLAHSNEIAARLTEIGTIGLVVNIMSQHSHDTHLQRNCCAALSNMSSSSGYIHNLVECLGIERLFASLNLAAINPSSQIEPLAEQALFVIDIDWTKIRMTSLHIAAKKGLYQSVYKCISLMYQQIDSNSSYDENINIIDSNGNTPLHFSIEHQHEKVTQLLISRGCNLYKLNKNDKTPFDLLKNKDDEHYNSMMNAVQNGLSCLKTAKQIMNKMLCEIKICSDHREIENEDDIDLESEDEEYIILPIEIGGIIVDYIDAFEIMDFYGNDEFSKNGMKKILSNECLTNHHIMHKQ